MHSIKTTLIDNLEFYNVFIGKFSFLFAHHIEQDCLLQESVDMLTSVLQAVSNSR